MKRYLIVPLLALTSLLLVHAQSQDLGLAPPVYATVASAPISELSGLVRSPRRDNLFWAHNDSGDTARIFALDGEGHSVLPTFSRFTRYGDTAEAGKTQWEGFEVLYADHVDWEDIAADEHYLYLADVGNNGNDRKDLAIYAISEIDPTASTRSAVVQKYPVMYPEQTAFPDPSWNFDSESLFSADGMLYLITKHRTAAFPHNMEPGARLYRLDTRYTDRDNRLVLVDSHDTLTAATGADLSPDGKRLAVVSYSALWLFERPADGGDHWLSAPSRQIPLNRSVFRQVEAVAWMDNDHLLLGNEQRDLFRISLESPGM